MGAGPTTNGKPDLLARRTTQAAHLFHADIGCSGGRCEKHESNDETEEWERFRVHAITTAIPPPEVPPISEDARVSAFRIVVLASGSGTNLQAILDALHGQGLVEVVGVGSDKPGARALERATAAGIDTAVFPADAYADRMGRDAAMGDWVESHRPGLVVLAGYMQLLSPTFVARFRNRVVNIHPALLPAFPGLDAIGQALAAGVDETGVTVHFVDEGVDTGPPIVQRQVPIPAGRDRAELEEAVHAVEHEIYPEAIRMIARGLVRIDDSDQSVVIVDE
jgi:phosphoribosylglycinamide formyltransferase 1